MIHEPSKKKDKQEIKRNWAIRNELKAKAKSKALDSVKKKCC